LADIRFDYPEDEVELRLEPSDDSSYLLVHFIEGVEEDVEFDDEDDWEYDEDGEEE
jgi:hypothetical protein